MHLGAGQRLEFRRLRSEHGGELIVLRGDVERHAVVARFGLSEVRRDCRGRGAISDTAVNCATIVFIRCPRFCDRAEANTAFPRNQSKCAITIKIAQNMFVFARHSLFTPGAMR